MAPLLVIAATLQSSVISLVRVFGVCPNLVLLLCISWVLIFGAQESLWVGLVGGLMLDILSGAPFGLSIIALTVASYLAGLGESNVFRTVSVWPFLAIAAATLVYNIILLFLLQTTGREILWVRALWRIILPATVLNMVCMPIVYGLTRWLKALVEPKAVEWQ